jgi:hypothetical protein
MNSSPQGSFPGASIPKYNVWRQQTRVLEDIAAYDTGGPGLNVSGGDRPEQLKGIHISYEFFHLFGAQPVLGRTFTAAEDLPHGGNLVVISNGLWQRRFGAAPANDREKARQVRFLQSRGFELSAILKLLRTRLP